ncbi:TPA: VWA domain-containing protein [Candidatus Poribacteria bacterium]|nr:VWA domain-containing protein [Candidatus Poribacteria bacterium]
MRALGFRSSMLVSLLLSSLCSLQSTPSNHTWANLMPRHAVPRSGFSMPSEQEFLPLLADREAEMSERIDALKALAYLGVKINYSDLKAMKRNLHDDAALISYVRCLSLCGEVAREPLQKYIKHRSPAVRAEAIYGFARYFEGGRDVAHATLSERKLHAWQRVAAIRALADVDLSLAQVEVMRRLGSESGEVLLECLEILRRDLSDDYIPVLIELLKKGRSRATAEASAMLQQITGYKIGNDYRSWHIAYLRHRVAHTSMRAPEQSTTQLRTVAYMGIPIFSDNICFVLDSSSSMTERMYEMRRMTRAAKVIEEFDKMLPILPSTSRFNVVFFESLIHEMYEQLTLVTPESKEYASVFVSTNNFSGGTNLFGGIVRSFEFSGIEEVIVLSDGDPSVGDYTKPWQIMVELDRLNRWRNIRISSISFSAPRAAESLMYLISAYNAGHFRDID